MPGLDGKKVQVIIKPVEGCIRVMPPSCKHDFSLINATREYEDVVYITKWKSDQEAFARATGGVFQNDEAQGLNELFESAKDFDKRDGNISTKRLFDFLELCATGVSSELGSYRKNIQKGNCDFKQIKKHPEFGVLIKAVYDKPDNEEILAVLNWIRNEKGFKLHRKELLSEMTRALSYSSENGISISDAAQRIRTIPGLQRKYPGYSMLSSRTVLSKGLEFDCVVIDLEKSMSVTDYYVAMTRAKRQVILISDKSKIILDAPKL